MLKVSTKSRYGLRTMIFLAKSKNKILSLREISKKENISFVYLEKIILKLKKAGLVESKKGAQGGYLLAKKPEEIKISQIVLALEGEMGLIDCISRKKKENCFFKKKCLTKSLWLNIQNSIEQILDSTSLADLIK